MEVVHPLNRIPVLLPRLQSIHHMDAANHDYTVVFLLDFAPDIRREGSITRTDSARLQRASEGSR